MSEYLEDWQMEELNKLDDMDIDYLVRALEYKIYSLKEKDPLRKCYIDIWQNFRKINVFEEVKFH